MLMKVFSFFSVAIYCSMVLYVNGFGSSHYSRQKSKANDVKNSLVSRKLQTSDFPTVTPSVGPSLKPTNHPSVKPTGPTFHPTVAPTLEPNFLNNPPPCIQNESDIAYVNGMISATQTLYNCLANVADPMNIPTFYNGTFNGVMIVNTSLQLNNLQDIDATAGTASMDFYLRLYWQDNRLSMPLFWEKMSPTVRANGVELTLILLNDSIGLWTPDVRFHDAAELDYIVQTIRINSSNVIFWSRHTIATFMQPLMNFDNYPGDTQCINVRFGSFAYNQNFFKMNYWGPALSLNQNYDGSYTFESNPIWTYQPDQTYYTTYTSSSGFLNSIYHIYVKRKGNGIVVRLVLPITLLLILAGLTFWAQYDSRVDSTTTLLLSVSALYIVILSNIPLLGYLTAIDRYVFWMFLLLVLVVGLHHTYATVQEKSEVWPLRVFYMRTIEFAGRTGVFPCVILYYLTQITEIDQVTHDMMFGIVVSATVIIFCREYLGVKKAWKTSLDNLLIKINNPEIKINELSIVEIVVFNYWHFNKYSTSIYYIAEYLHKTGEFDNPNKIRLDLRNLYAFRESTFGDVDLLTKNNSKKGGREKSRSLEDGNNQSDGEIMLSTFKSSLAAKGVVVDPNAKPKYTNNILLTASNNSQTTANYSSHEGNISDQFATHPLSTAGAGTGAVPNVVNISSRPQSSNFNNNGGAGGVNDSSNKVRMSLDDYPDSDDER